MSCQPGKNLSLKSSKMWTLHSSCRHLFIPTPYDTPLVTPVRYLYMDHVGLHWMQPGIEKRARGIMFYI